MNKKGFTLIEILVVVAILGVISLVTIPNVLEMSDRTKKSQMVNDAEELVNKAKNRYTLDKETSNNITYDLDDLEFSGTDGYGDSYTIGNVVIKKSGSTYEYKVYLETSEHCLSTGTICNSNNGILSNDLDIKYVIENEN